YFSATSASRSLKITTRCHSVRSLRSPDILSRQLSEVATARLAIRIPSCVERISGSRPRLPTRITLLMLPAIGSPPCRVHRSPSYQTAQMFLLYSYHGYLFLPSLRSDRRDPARSSSSGEFHHGRGPGSARRLFPRRDRRGRPGRARG